MSQLEKQFSVIQTQDKYVDAINAVRVVLQDLNYKDREAVLRSVLLINETEMSTPLCLS